MENGKNTISFGGRKYEYEKVSIDDSDFLERLKFLKKPANSLWYYGTIPKCSGKGLQSGRFPKEKRGRPKVVAIVGARKMTSYGETHAFNLAKRLSELGIIVASGMATGIDSAAHRGALAGYRERNGDSFFSNCLGSGQVTKKVDIRADCDLEGFSNEKNNADTLPCPTIAFLGTPISKIYPSQNRRLFEEIIGTGGAVFSEYGPEESPMFRSSFLTRNRLIAGVADAVVVVEADLKSGSLNTAAHAIEQGVPLLAIPGDLSRQMSRGCNQLFGKGVAACTCIEDVLNVLYPGGIKHRIEKKESPEFVGTEDEKKILKVLTDGSESGDEILEKIASSDSEFDATRFNIAITMLEIKGVVKREFGNRWTLA